MERDVVNGIVHADVRLAPRRMHQVDAWPTASRTLGSHGTHVGHDRAWPQALSGTHFCAGR